MQRNLEVGKNARTNLSSRLGTSMNHRCSFVRLFCLGVLSVVNLFYLSRYF